MPKISVIVPVYNAEKYLQRCVDSILAQTFTDFELLLINDGSKDTSGEICDEYVVRDNRVRVFHKENGGVSSARNVGLDNAMGEWITFVDSDDWLPIDALLNYSVNGYEDLVIGGYKNHNSDRLICLDWCGNVVKSSGFSDFLSQNIDSTSFRVPWCKLFKKQIIELCNLRFDESLVFGEDTVFVTSYLLSCESVFISNKYCYNYYNIGDNYISKYKEHSDSICRYSEQITLLYNKIGVMYSLSGTRIVYGFMFDILKKNFNEGKITTRTFAMFLRNTYVVNVLTERNSKHIYMLLFLARHSRIGLFLYNKLTNFLTSICQNLRFL